VSAPLVYIIAGEPSGDSLGGKLMAALKERTGGAVRFAGIGGETMAAEGLASIAPIADLAIMGVTEVLPSLRRIFRHMAAAVADIRQLKPAAVVTIDSSGFTWRVAQRLRRLGETELPLIHYVAPMVWAWRPGNAQKMARWYDHLMVLLPFEPPYFTAVGLACTYVGHPVVESGADAADGADFRRRHGIPASAPVVAVLPGSRRGEVKRLLPVFGEAVARLAARQPGLRVLVPTRETVAATVSAAAATWAAPAIIVRGEAEKYAAFAASNAAIAASGTVALELAMAKVPHLVGYRVLPLTHWQLRRIVKVKYMHLLNLILDRAVVPELVQQDCEPNIIAEEIARLLDDPARREAQVAACQDALHRLGLGELRPSYRAADVVLSIVAERARTDMRPSAA
jgi:lipid-A-disaccharide synthase